MRKTKKSRKRKKGLRSSVPGSYTVEAAGVMSVLLFAIMILFNEAFHVRAETVGEFQLHHSIEQKRHLIENSNEKEISEESGGQRWSLEVTAQVFRPENSLRMWSLVEDIK